MIFKLIKPLKSGLRIDDTHTLAFLEEDTFHPYVGLDCYNVVVDKVSLSDSAGILVTVDDIIEVRLRMCGRRGGQPDLDSVEVVEGISPRGLLCSRVATMALIRDDDVERMMGYFQLLRIVLNVLIAAPDGLASKQIDGHALDGANVDKCMLRLRRLEIGFRQNFWVKLLGFLQVIPLEALAVYLVNLVELLARLGLKGGEGSNCLRGEHAPIDKKKNALRPRPR